VTRNSRAALIACHSLGATTAMTFVAANPPGTVKAVGDFYGFLTPAIRAGVSRFPPTIIVHNKNDEIVPVENSEEFDALLPATIPHQFVPPYDETSEIGRHALKPGGPADIDSRAKVTEWFTTHLPVAGQ
jgi:dienelactone hydrolase